MAVCYVGCTHFMAQHRNLRLITHMKVIVYDCEFVLQILQYYQILEYSIKERLLNLIK